MELHEYIIITYRLYCYVCSQGLCLDQLYNNSYSKVWYRLQIPRSDRNFLFNTTMYKMATAPTWPPTQQELVKCKTDHSFSFRVKVIMCGALPSPFLTSSRHDAVIYICGHLYLLNLVAQGPIIISVVSSDFSFLSVNCIKSICFVSHCPL